MNLKLVHCLDGKAGGSSCSALLGVGVTAAHSWSSLTQKAPWTAVPRYPGAAADVCTKLRQSSLDPRRTGKLSASNLVKLLEVTVTARAGGALLCGCEAVQSASRVRGVKGHSRPGLELSTLEPEAASGAEARNRLTHRHLALVHCYTTCLVCGKTTYTAGAQSDVC